MKGKTLGIITVINLLLVGITSIEWYFSHPEWYIESWPLESSCMPMESWFVPFFLVMDVVFVVLFWEWRFIAWYEKKQKKALK